MNSFVRIMLIMLLPFSFENEQKTRKSEGIGLKKVGPQRIGEEKNSLDCKVGSWMDIWKKRE